MPFLKKILKCVKILILESRSRVVEKSVTRIEWAEHKMLKNTSPKSKNNIYDKKFLLSATKNKEKLKKNVEMN